MPIIFLVNALCNLFKLQMCMAIYCHALCNVSKTRHARPWSAKNTVAGLLRNAMKRSEWLLKRPAIPFQERAASYAMACRIL